MDKHKKLKVSHLKVQEVDKCWNDALEFAAQQLEIMSLLQEYNDCFNQSKPGCAAILADRIREYKR